MKISTILLSALALVLAITSGFLYAELQKTQSVKKELEQETSSLNDRLERKERQYREDQTQARQIEEKLRVALNEKDKTIKEQQEALGDMNSFQAQLPKVTIEGPAQEGWRSAVQEQSKLVEYLGRELKDTGMTVYRQDPYVIVQVPESTFAFGSSRTSKELIKGLSAVADVFNSYKGDYLLAIEGHTDNVPLTKTGRFESNWELGAARATSVITRLISMGVNPSNLALVSRSEYLPMVSHADPTEDAANRRVELVFAPRRYVQQANGTPAANENTLKSQATVPPPAQIETVPNP